MATLSLWTSILQPIMSRRKFRLFESALGIIAIVGISVVLDAVIDQWVGFAVAVLSAFMSAIFTIINGGFVKKYNHPYAGASF